MILIGLIILIFVLIFSAASPVVAAGGETQNNMSLKKAYLYLVSIISLVIAVVGAIILINLALKTWVFTKADMNYYSSPCYSSKPVSPTGTPEPCSPQEQARQEKQQKDDRTAQKQRDASQAVAMILVAGPVWYFHWRLARKEA